MRRVILAVAAALLLPGCSLPLFGSERAVANVLIPVGDRQPAPAVSAETLDGERLDLADLDGPAVVNFWASWCGPCATEAPHLAATAAAYADQGVAFVGVNVQDQLAAAQAFERDFDIAYPSWFDQAGTIAASFGGIGPSALPATIILDAQHRVAVRMIGAVTQDQLSGHLDQILSEG